MEDLMEGLVIGSHSPFWSKVIASRLTPPDDYQGSNSRFIREASQEIGQKAADSMCQKLVLISKRKLFVYQACSFGNHTPGERRGAA